MDNLQAKYDVALEYAAEQIHILRSTFTSRLNEIKQGLELKGIDTTDFCQAFFNSTCTLPCTTLGEALSLKDKVMLEIEAKIKERI